MQFVIQNLEGFLMDYVTHCHPIQNIRSHELMKVNMRGFDNKKKSLNNSMEEVTAKSLDESASVYPLYVQKLIVIIIIYIKNSNTHCLQTLLICCSNF